MPYQVHIRHFFIEQCSTKYLGLLQCHDGLLLSAGGQVLGQSDTWARSAIIMYVNNWRQFVFSARRYDNKASSYICQLQHQGLSRVNYSDSFYCECGLCRRSLWKQEAQLPQRNSASAVHVYLGWLTDRAMHRIAEVLFLTFKRLIQEVLAENAFCHEIAAQGHSRSFTSVSYTHLTLPTKRIV